MSTSRTRGLCAATIAGAAVVAVALAGTAGARLRSTVVLKATLTGHYLHTAATGHGTATLTFTASKACWKFTYSGIDTPNVSGIHETPPPAAGYHKVSIFPYTATTSEKPGCEALDRWGKSAPGWAAKVIANPSHFYVIIGTGRYPNGAIGGVLHKA